jgi:hypothetical protein
MVAEGYRAVDAAVNPPGHLLDNVNTAIAIVDLAAGLAGSAGSLPGIPRESLYRIAVHDECDRPARASTW